MKTKKKIHNRTQLRNRLNSLQNDLPVQEEKIQGNFRHFRDSLSPQNILIHSLSSITGVNINKKEFLREGVVSGIGLLFQRFLTRTESTVEKKVYHVMDLLFKKVEDVIHRYASRSEAASERIADEEK